MPVRLPNQRHGQDLYRGLCQAIGGGMHDQRGDHVWACLGLAEAGRKTDRETTGEPSVNGPLGVRENIRGSVPFRV